MRIMPTNRAGRRRPRWVSHWAKAPTAGGVRSPRRRVRGTSRCQVRVHGGAWVDRDVLSRVRDETRLQSYDRHGEPTENRLSQATGAAGQHRARLVAELDTLAMNTDEAEDVVQADELELRPIGREDPAPPPVSLDLAALVAAPAGPPRPSVPDTVAEANRP